jgi:hypothetical protein
LALQETVCEEGSSTLAIVFDLDSLIRRGPSNRIRCSRVVNFDLLAEEIENGIQKVDTDGCVLQAREERERERERERFVLKNEYE